MHRIRGFSRPVRDAGTARRREKRHGTRRYKPLSSGIRLPSGLSSDFNSRSLQNEALRRILKSTDHANWLGIVGVESTDLESLGLPRDAPDRDA